MVNIAGKINRLFDYTTRYNRFAREITPSRKLAYTVLYLLYDFGVAVGITVILAVKYLFGVEWRTITAFQEFKVNAFRRTAIL